MDNTREKLAELLQELEDLPFGTYLEEADHLIANGVKIPVLCKECKHWDEEEQECIHWYGFHADDFCSYGERRTEE